MGKKGGIFLTLLIYTAASMQVAANHPAAVSVFTTAVGFVVHGMG